MIPLPGPGTYSTLDGTRLSSNANWMLADDFDGDGLRDLAVSHGNPDWNATFEGGVVEIFWGSHL